MQCAGKFLSNLGNELDNHTLEMVKKKWVDRLKYESDDDLFGRTERATIFIDTELARIKNTKDVEKFSQVRC